ncbi:hypothetical protein NL676_035284 [Syzygium grande]|nr:hypothetical protein NL676_035284 [Syzygium grande]
MRWPVTRNSCYLLSCFSPCRPQLALELESLLAVTFFDAGLPKIPELPKACELPPVPTAPALPEPELPSLPKPEVQTLPKPESPPLPEPEVPKAA